MATVVSHAMRRFASSPDANYSSCGLRSEQSRWSEGRESALSRSMRYAEPWLYDSVRAPSSGLLLAPALVLCSCQDYLTGTKRSTKKSQSICKKCKGTRLPLGDSKFGTMRCYPTSTMAPTPTRAGTVRVTSSCSRPSILPSADPYDLMRRSRLSVPSTTTENSTSQFRARSVSPNKGRSRSNSDQRRHHKSNNSNSTKYSTIGRKSILECSVNPYDLIATDSSITLVNGQRIRVRPQIAEPDYEDIVTPTPKSQQSHKLKIKSAQTSSPKSNEKESEGSNSNSISSINSNRFKSILKKPSAAFGDTDSVVDPERSPSPAHRSGSHFYLPMPRKKVQFLVENEENGCIELPVPEEPTEPEPLPQPPEDIAEPSEPESPRVVDDAKVTEVAQPRSCKLKRSESERAIKEVSNKVVFHDSMALRPLQARTDSRIVFSEKDLERLDGISATKKVRPKQPPPESPPPSVELETSPETSNDFVPSAPPRKRSNNKQPYVVLNQDAALDTVVVETPLEIPVNVEKVLINHSPKYSEKIFIQNDYEDEQESNRTILQINTNNSIHKLKIKNEYPENNNINTISISDNNLGRTSITINGDDCYSTIKVCDEIPLYHSSVVVKDSGITIDNRKSSTVYITGNFVNVEPSEENIEQENKTKTKDAVADDEEVILRTKNPPNNVDLLRCLSDPVEAVRMNLVPHVCGKSDTPRRPRDLKNIRNEPLTELQSLSEEDKVKKFIEESFLKLKNNDIIDLDDKDACSEHSSSTQYEIMDHGSECYTDHSNRSSITEEELNARTKFYELLADSAIIEVSEHEDHHYESIKVNPDPIYEEIEIPPPLPANPPPSSLLDDLQLDKEYTTRSIFEGASKYDILSYLVDAKERGIVPEDNYTYNFGNADVVIEEEHKDSTEIPYNRVSHMSTVSDSSEDSSLIMPCSLTDEKAQRTAEVERNDSGVGSETSKSSLSKYRMKQDVVNILCEDCENSLDNDLDHEPLICRKCIKKRTERKEIITEIVETEEKYSRDLQIILEEFYQPMLVAGLLTSDQLSAIFLNVEELLENSQALAERLRDAVEIAVEQGDEDLQTVNIGKLFLEAAPMLHGFETYCIRQGPASLLLASLEKEKELLRIFLRVSQMENTVLRRMNLNSFLMVPVQRVTKYPLLLARLYKVTPAHHNTKELLKEAQHKIELHLNHMNSETKDVPSKLWRRISNIPGRRSSSEMDLVNIKLRKIAVDVLEWNHDEAKFALEGRLLFTQPTDNNWRKGRTIKLTPVNALLVTNGKSTSVRNDPTAVDESLVFSRQAGIRDAALLLVRDKNGRYSLLREPLYLDRCVIAADPAWQSYFEVQELMGKDTFIFKAEDEDQTKLWYRQLQYYAQGMGAWRRRRNALANIMINGMGLRS